jgi:glycosyltransferase involved in cell wall biosynthesis
MTPAAPDRPGARPIRVLHAYSGNLYGGVEAMLATLARQRHLAPGMAPEFALCFEGRLAEELRAAGAAVHPLGGVRLSRPWTVLAARRRLARRLRAPDRPDVVVCHACWPHAAFGPTARRAGLPLVHWQHDLAGEPGPIDRRAMRTPPRLVVANSRATAATTARLFPGAAVEVVHCPVAAPPPPSPASRAEVRRELGTPADAAVVVTACRLERWKGHALLVEALGRLADRPGWAAWVVGGAQRPHERAYLDELAARAAALGLGDRVRFLGQRSDVPRLLAAADVHCQPNLAPEPFGVAYVEALYAGLPVVASRLGGAAEIVDEACGVLVPPGDADALAGALGRLLGDPAERARLGAAGPPRAASLCDPPATLGRLAGLLGGLAAGGGTPAAGGRGGPGIFELPAGPPGPYPVL